MSTSSVSTTADNGESDNIDISNVDHNSKHLSIGYLQVQLMFSSFDKFQVIHHIYPFDILTLLETWLIDDKRGVKNDEMPGYEYTTRTEMKD